MLIKKHLALLVATLVIIQTSNQAQAQYGGGPVPGEIGGSILGQDAYTSNSFAADFDPMALDYDMAAFAPLDISEYGQNRKSRGGFFAKYDRTYMSLTRPQIIPGSGAAFSTPVGEDYIPGNHYNIGYLNDDGNGWEMDYLKSEGSFFSGTPAVGGFTPMFTTSRIDTVQLNRVFRSDLSHGGYLEPFVGLRYLSFRDRVNSTGNTTRRDFNDPTDFTDDVILPVNGRLDQESKNSAAGGQIGMRLSKQHGRWSLTSGIAVAGFYNSQRSAALTQLRSPAGPTLPALLGVTPAYGSENTFVPMVDASIRGTYGITRDLSLRMGLELIHMWDGLNRANTVPGAANPNFGTTGPVPTTSQDATLVGFQFGIEWRR